MKLQLRQLLVCALLGCGEQQLDVVTGGPSCLEQPERAQCERPVWPNEFSSANSDAWLAAHHDALRELRPRVLVLDYHNDRAAEEVRGVAETQIEALAEGSRYRAYVDDRARSFVHYQLLDVIDLKDRQPASDWAFPSSSRVPLNEEGRFDLPLLFGREYAELYGFRDDQGQPLELCQLFERGLINELWLAVGDGEPGREPPSMIECKAPYGEDGRRSEGELVGAANADDCAILPACAVTVRIAHLSPVRGVGCDLLVRAWGIRGSVRAIPYLERNARAFLEECGDPEVPPNTTEKWDFDNASVVEARCAHYGLRDGPDGDDMREPYSAATVSALAAEYPDCGGGWQIYWRQSIPGFDNQAFAEDGEPMKNWWPFLFY
jgi:hypothetical protein